MPAHANAISGGAYRLDARYLFQTETTHRLIRQRFYVEFTVHLHLPVCVRPQYLLCTNRKSMPVQPSTCRSDGTRKCPNYILVHRLLPAIEFFLFILVCLLAERAYILRISSAVFTSLSSVCLYIRCQSQSAQLCSLGGGIAMSNAAISILGFVALLTLKGDTARLGGLYRLATSISILACLAKLPTGLYILPSVTSFVF